MGNMVVIEELDGVLRLELFRTGGGAPETVALLACVLATGNMGALAALFDVARDHFIGGCRGAGGPAVLAKSSPKHARKTAKVFELELERKLRR